ncbi:MAG: PfkB family carbohydrate kinase [Lentimicrobium sp.]
MIWCVGESLYDIVFTNGQPLWAVPGGSMLNAAVSAARYGEKVGLLTELGDDAVGNLIGDFLTANGISVEKVSFYKGNTTLALAFLNSAGDAQYQFYHHAPVQAPDFSIPEFRPGDVLIFGSFYSIKLRNRLNISRLSHAAREAGAWIYYDPNFRKPHLNELELSLPFIRENIALADIVRGSDEDFKLIAGADSPGDAYRFIQENGCQNLILTCNSRGVELFAGNLKRHFNVPQVEVVSTIGAGDSFNAGFATALHGIEKIILSGAFWDEAISRAVIFASEVCCSRDNFIGKPGEDIQ